MPSKHYSDKFRYDIDEYEATEDLPDEAFREDMQELKLEKLGHRVTLITILIPILIAVIIVVSYLDIKQKVVQTQNTGTMGVQNLSKNLESRFSSLSVRQAKLEDTLAKQVKTLEKDQAQYAVDRKKLEDTISTVSQQMVNKDDLTETAKRFNAALGTLQAEISTTNSNLTSIESASTKSLNKLILLEKNIQKKFDGVSKRTSALAEEKLSKSQLDLALKIRDLRLQEQFQEQTKTLENEITTLKEKSDQLSKDLNLALDRIKKISNSPAAQKTNQSTSPPKTPAKPAASPAKEGGIVEQDLN